MTVGVKSWPIASGVLTVVVFGLLSCAVGCQKKSAAFPLSMATVQQIHSGSMSFEERGAAVFVAVTDRFGDCHIHRLDYQGLSKVQAVAILKTKVAELEKAHTTPSAAPNGAESRR